MLSYRRQIASGSTWTHSSRFAEAKVEEAFMTIDQLYGLCEGQNRGEIRVLGLNDDVCFGNCLFGNQLFCHLALSQASTKLLQITSSHQLKRQFLR